MLGSTFTRGARIGSAAFVAFLLAPVTAAAGVTASPMVQRPASHAACTTAGLVVWLDTNGNGAAGSAYYALKFTNLSGHPCVLSGYPGVSAVNLGGQQLGSAATRNAAHAPHSITLANGATASAVLQIAQAANFPNSTCHRTMAAGIRVFPPNQTTAKVVPFPFSACAQTGPIYLTVQAL